MQYTQNYALFHIFFDIFSPGRVLDRPQFPVDLQLRFRSAWTLTFLLALLLVLELNFSYYVIS